MRDVGGARLLRATRGRIFSRQLSLAYRWPSSLFLFTLPPLFAYLCVQISPLHKDTSRIGLGPTLTISV